MTADTLLASLISAGLHVVEQPGWKTRGNKWARAGDGKPEGVMQHGTGLPNPYPMRRLYGPLLYRTKANIGTTENGELHLIAYNACNYSSGRGSLKVLRENVRKSIAPTHNALVRGLKSGNRSFWNFENSHPNDRSDIPQVQLDTIIESTRIVLDHFDLDPEQVISHAEWTRRKVDPLWNGSNRIAIEQIREAVMFTKHEKEELKRLVASLDSVKSNGGFAAPAVKLIRKERVYPIDHHDVDEDTT